MKRTYYQRFDCGGKDRTAEVSVGSGRGTLACLMGEVVVASRTPYVCSEATSPIVLVLDRLMAGRVAGQVVDSKEAPLKYPRVRIYRESETTPRYDVHGDETGRFRIDDVAHGVYTIVIAVEGLGEVTLPSVGVSAGQITDLGAMVWI